jgi:2-polyprenyl-3-methyl-5-hydroxy-6-metoxy-1,4-benzoquinol methylase
MSVHDTGEQAVKQQNNDYAARLWQYKQAETISLMIHVGRRLGLYHHMAGQGPMSASELSKKSGLHERWLLEWMRLQAAGKVLNYVTEGERFELPEIGVELLGNDKSPSYMLENFDGGTPIEAIDALLESFRTGLGNTYESSGPEGAKRGETRHWKAARRQVVPKMIPALKGVEEKLTNGCLVADIGCGDGAVILALAESFPNSTFHAYDPNKHAVARVKEVALEMGIKNVDVQKCSGENIPGKGKYDFVITFDCLHDMTHPELVIAQIREIIREDGTWFIKDIRSKPRFEDNLRNPMLAMMYGFSLMSCMSSAMSTKDGAGLGTLGFNPEVAETMSHAAGFTQFKMHDFKDPGNLYYEVRP